MEKLLEKIITVSSVTNLNPEDKKPISFKDENGDKYTLFKFKKDGTKSMAYQMFETLPYGGEGSTIGIAYTEEPKTFVNEQGKEISFTQRTVVVVKKPSEIRVANQVPNSYNSFAQHSDNSSAPKPVAKTEEKTDWDKIAFGKSKHGFLIEAFKANLGNPNIKLSEIEAIAEEWARASMRILPKTTAQSFGLAELPTIQQDETVSVDDLPF